jgi:hypothetical protein
MFWVIASFAAQIALFYVSLRYCDRFAVQAGLRPYLICLTLPILAFYAGAGLLFASLSAVCPQLAAVFGTVGVSCLVMILPVVRLERST